MIGNERNRIHDAENDSHRQSYFAGELFPVFGILSERDNISRKEVKKQRKTERKET